MTTATATRRMSVEEFLALPDDGVRRWLIDGEVREYGMTVRNRDHSRVMMRVGQLLGNWLDNQPIPRGELVGGEAGFILPGDPAKVIGLDIAYIDADLATQKPDDTTLFEGVPVLAVEVVSPNDTVKYLGERGNLLLKAGVKIVWFIDPDAQTVLVRRKGALQMMFNAQQELTAEPELPGFRVKVASLFSR